MDYLKRTWAEVSLDAIKHNFNEIKNKVGGRAKICCVIKADGYGHGAVELSKIYEQLGADFFAVSNIDEGIEIREAGATLPIVILGFTPANGQISITLKRECLDRMSIFSYFCNDLIGEGPFFCSS